MKQTQRDLVRMYRGLHREYSNHSIWELVATAPNIPYTGDRLFLSGLGDFGVVFIAPNFVPLSDYMGFPHNRLVNERAPMYLTPRPKKLDWSGRDDNDKYGTVLGNFVNFVNPGVVGDSYKYEHSVEHTAYAGMVRTQHAEPIYARSNTPNLDFHPGLDLFPYHVRAGHRALGTATAVQSGLSNYSFNLDGHLLDHGAPFDFDALEITQTMIAAINARGSDGFNPVRLNTPGLRPFYFDAVDSSSWKGELYHFDLGYRYELRTQWDDIIAFQVHIDTLVGFAPNEGSNDPYSRNSIPHGAFICVDHSEVVPLWANHGLTPVVTFQPRVLPSWDAGFFSELDQVATSFTEDFAEFRSHTPTQLGDVVDIPRHSVLHKNTRLNLPELRPSSFLAASDALDTNITILSANALQTMQHLGDIMNVLPDVASLAPLVRRCAQGDVTVIPDLVDYITSAILRYNFVQRPLIKDGRQLFATDLRKSLDILLQPKTTTMYGSFHYTFTESENFFGPGRLELLTHAKVRVTMDLSTAMVAYFAANSVGAAPNLARLWSLLPGSFIVDWFINMSKRLHQVDNQLTWLAMRTDWCIWSYKVAYTPTQGELAAYNLVDYDPIGDPFRILSYWREFSAYGPALRNSKFDFLRPTNSPSLATVGSLLWQLR